MKDLKHLIFFENLLQEAQNELVTQAVNEGKLGLGYNCYYTPEVLLNLPGCFSSRLRAPRCTSPDIATFFLLNPVKNDKFFVTIMDPPMKEDQTSLDYYKAQLQLKVVEPLRDKLGVDVSEEAMRKAVEDFNELCDVITEIGNFRKLENPPITGYEFHVIQLVSQACPHYLILPYLRETLEEIRNREPEPKFPYRARIILAGSEIDDPDFTKLVESCGAMVVADRYCFGSFPSRERIEIAEGESAFDAIARHYLHWNQCARFMSGGKIDQRHTELKRLVEEFGADGIVYESMKFPCAAKRAGRALLHD